jgi:hypothetical protein
VVFFKLGAPFFLAVPAAIAVTAVFGAVLALPALRVRGPYLAMVTIAFAFIVQHGTIEWKDLTGGQSGLMGLVPPAIPELRRRLLLTRLVLAWSVANGEVPLLPGQAAALAAALARLLDAAASEERSFDKLRELVPDDLAAHWQTVLRFLEILPHAWPPILAAEGALDPAERRNLLLRRQAEAWRRTPPAGPVIAAGLTGGIPALVELLGVIAWQDQGAVILPGLDRSCDAEEWALIGEEPAHPQHLMALLLGALDIPPDQVRDWPPRGPPVWRQPPPLLCWSKAMIGQGSGMRLHKPWPTQG